MKNYEPMNDSEYEAFLQSRSRMLFPQDKGLEARYYVLLDTLCMLHQANDTSEHICLPQESVYFLIDLVYNYKLSTKCKTSWLHGMTAGEVFLRLVEFMHHNPKQASLLKACAKVEEDHIRKGDQIRVTKDIRRYFQKYKDVVHLWAASLVMETWKEEDFQEAPASFNFLNLSEDPLDPNRFRIFMMLAESYRFWGVRTKCERRAKGEEFILDKETAWKFPNEIAPRPIAYFVPGSGEDLNEFIKKYTTEK